MEASVLSQPALVLNRSWTAIATVPVRKALRLIYTGAAKVIRPDTYELHSFETWADLVVSHDEPHIKSVTLRIRVPEVIVLSRYNGVPNQTAVFTRRNLYRRDKNTCQYCGGRPGTPELTIDHVIPRSRGGKGTWENCVLACVTCNRRKGSRLPHEVSMMLLTAPVRPRWSPTLQIPVGRVRQSWEKFISDRYWDVSLEP